MSKKNCILKRKWQSKTGLQEELYLGYNENDKLDYISNLQKAKVMTEEECQEWLLVLTNSKQIVIDTLPEELIQNEITEENANEQPNN